MDQQNPYQTPESFDQPATESSVPARPVLALLLTTFGVGAILVVLMILVEMQSPPSPPLRHLPFLLVPYMAWVCVPGLAAGVIASRISRKLASPAELPAVALLLFMAGCTAFFSFQIGPPTVSEQTMVVLVSAWIFQFWVAGRLGRFFQGTGQSGMIDYR